MAVSKGYKEAIIDLHDKTRWGDSGGCMAGESVIAFLIEHPEIKTILDYGCGEGTLKSCVETAGISDKQWTLYDPGMPEYSEKPEGKFDLVITTDVLEHVEPHMLRSTLYELYELTGKFLYNDIACYLTERIFRNGPYIGQDLHINLRAPDDWMVQLSHLDLNTISHTITLQNGWKLRYLSIQEVK